MKNVYCRVFALACAAVLLYGAVPATAGECVSGTITSQVQVGGPYDGLYKYTVTIAWATPQGLSHATLDCGFRNCVEAACLAQWHFDDPAGTGTGEPNDCKVEFDGEFNCDGDPTIPTTDPVLKWDAVGTDDCEAGATGTATLCFYTGAPPKSEKVPIVLVKNGQNVCEGEIEGDCPFPCVVSVEPSSWTSLKDLYR